MAIAVTNLTSGSDTDGNSTASTASVTPTGNRLILLSVSSRTGISTQPNTPTATGNGLTWVQINTIYWDTDSSSRKTTTLFRAMGASPSSGAISIDFGGQNQTDVLWSVDEVSGMDTSGTNGSGAIVQSVTNIDEVSGGGTITVTLAAFSDTNNGTFGIFGADTNTTIGVPLGTVGSGFTLLAQPANTFEILSEWKSTNDTTVDATFNSAAGGKMGGIAIEIKIAAAAQVGISAPQRLTLGVGT